jgi:2'-5' RNA ligase
MKKIKYIKLFESFVEAPIIFEAALLLKLDSNTKSEIKKLFDSDKPEGLFPLPEDKLHITLTSIKSCKENKAKLKESLPKMNMPKILLGKTTLAQRPESGKKSFVVSIENQDEIKKFVDDIYEKMELTNPEPDRYFHITIANNIENKKSPGFADPFSSISDIKKEDF